MPKTWSVSPGLSMESSVARLTFFSGLDSRVDARWFNQMIETSLTPFYPVPSTAMDLNRQRVMFSDGVLERPVAN